MSLELVFYFTRSNVPDHRKIIVTAWRQSTGIMLEPTDLPSVPLKLEHDIMRGPDIMANNFGVSGSGKQKAISKCRRRYSTGMAFEGPEKGFCLGVIDLGFSIG